MRWIYLALPLVLQLLLGCAAQEAMESPSGGVQQPSGTIVAFGDSLTAGAGVPPGEAYPAHLERMLKANGYNYTVINMGRNGDTTFGALERVGSVIAAKPDIVILVIGANDATRLFDPAVTRATIEEVVEQLQAANITVIMAGSPVIDVQGWAYPGEFSRIHPGVAQEYGLAYLPFFLEGVAGNRSLNLDDGVHPNSRGYAIIAENLYPHVVQAIEQIEQR